MKGIEFKHVHIPVEVAVKLAGDLVAGDYRSALRDGVPFLLRAVANHIQSEHGGPASRDSSPKTPVTPRSGPGLVVRGIPAPQHVAATPPKVPVSGGGGI